MSRCSRVSSLRGLYVAWLITRTANNFNGDNLLECDQKILQEIGIKKIGDRVRIFVAIKQLRNKALINRKKNSLVSPPPLNVVFFSPMLTSLRILCWLLKRLRTHLCRQMLILPRLPATNNSRMRNGGLANWTLWAVGLPLDRHPL